MAVPRKGVPNIFRDVADTYCDISLWDGGPEAIGSTVMKPRDARLGLHESHDNSVGINAHHYY